MKTMAIATLLGLAAAGCSDEADIGISSQPIECMTVATADISGEVTDPLGGTTYEFKSATPTARRGLSTSTLVQLANDSGGRDNISVVLAQVVELFPARRGILDRILAWFG